MDLINSTWRLFSNTPGAYMNYPTPWFATLLGLSVLFSLRILVAFLPSAPESKNWQHVSDVLTNATVVGFITLPLAAAIYLPDPNFWLFFGGGFGAYFAGLGIGLTIDPDCYSKTLFSYESNQPSNTCSKGDLTVGALSETLLSSGAAFMAAAFVVYLRKSSAFQYQ